MASGESKIDRKLDYVNNTKALIRQAMTNKGIFINKLIIPEISIAK